MASGWIYRIVPLGSEGPGRRDHDYDSVEIQRQYPEDRPYIIEVKWVGAPDSDWRYYGAARTKKEAERRIRFLADRDTSAGGRDEQGSPGPTSDIR